MAMEASFDPSSDFSLLGVLATESEDLDSFNKLMDETGMSDCLKIVASKELDLYPPDGYTMDDAPETVRQLIEWVKAYPHQVTIYASASLTTVAYAEAADAAFAGNVKDVLMVAT